jgi:molybdopterin-containing oxidoreductase family membrane subunit
LVSYGYASEIFTAWWSGDVYEQSHIAFLFTAEYAPLWYGVLLCNSILPQLLWWRRVRTSVWGLFALSIAINVGMWSERFAIVVGSLHRDFMPSMWRLYLPTVWDCGMFAGTFGIFLFGFLLFIRFCPVLAVHEMVELVDRRESE